MSEDLSSEISRLWGKVSLPAETEVVVSHDPTSAAWETLALLKRRQAREARRWAELLEAKDKALQALAARQGAMEDELRLLRAQAAHAEERALEEAAEVQLRLAEAMKALTEEREGRRRDREAFSSALEAGREKAEAQAKRLREAEAARAELKALVASREHELLRAQAALKEAKLALEKTLSELLLARRER